MGRPDFISAERPSKQLSTLAVWFLCYANVASKAAQVKAAGLRISHGAKPHKPAGEKNTRVRIWAKKKARAQFARECPWIFLWAGVLLRPGAIQTPMRVSGFEVIRSAGRKTDYT